MQMTCPCGQLLTGDGEDELVAAAQQHLAEAHPGRTYTREQILFFADE